MLCLWRISFLDRQKEFFFFWHSQHNFFLSKSLNIHHWKWLKNFVKIKDHSKRWITRLMGRWRTQQTVRHRVNCRTHEHRHFERISQSMLLCTLINFRVLLGLHMVEGCKTMPIKLLDFNSFWNFKHMLCYWTKQFVHNIK